VQRASQVVALAVALAVGGWLIASKPPTRPVGKPVPRAQPSTLPTLVQTWPHAAITVSAGRLADGTAYTPWLYVSADTSVGTAPTPDGTAERLLLRTGNATPRELHQVPNSHFPQFLGFVADGDAFYWAESTATVDGPSETRIWRDVWKTATSPVSLTTDTGAAVFFNSQFDLVVANGQVNWIAAAPTDSPITELRSVPVTGGKVTKRTINGAYQMSSWPWLQSADGPNAPLNLLNTANGQKIMVSTSATELVGCTPAWCRALVTAPTGGATRFDVMKPDGTERRRVVGGNASAATSDVGFLDRFEILTQGTEKAQTLVLYDIQARKLTIVAENVGMILAKGGMLWWSTGDQEATQWHALNLGTLLT
jgi:hypothetical protein